MTVRQPWAWAIIHGGKDVENRVRNIAGDYRGPIAIHAAIGKTASLTEADEELLINNDIDGKVEAWMDGEPIEGGVILGVIYLIGVHHSGASDFGGEGTRFTPLCSEWAQQDAWHLELTNPRPLVEPIPYRGALGLRELDDDTTARILAQIGETA
ncbi:hypothetical protein [uncultured Microbacterium sp.]|uniref:hypothetical protein n=1 Tax=uncultured Microbacterium sp. TaxID=191216 RepID=UPI0025CF9313|nr:hypothetical protein [uncultured Microbacterium sp.]